MFQILQEFSRLEPVAAEDGVKRVVSVGQFRPEKDQVLQIKSFKRLLDIIDEEDIKKIRKEDLQLVLVGGIKGIDFYKFSEI